MRLGRRARVTIVDIILWLTAAAAMGGLWPVYANVVDEYAAVLGTGVAIVVKTLPPLMVLVLLATIIAKAGIGAK